MIKHLLIGVLLGSVLGSALVSGAERRKTSGFTSLIDTDPEVIYLVDLLPDDEPVELRVKEPAQVYSTKTGGRKLGVINGGKVRLIGFDGRACKVQGQGKIGWIKPSVLLAEEGNIQEVLKTVYTREIEVKRLIAQGEIALGMSRDEVCRVFGEPTKQTLRRTKDGISGTLEFTEYEEVRHFEPVFSPFSNNVFRRFTHSTQEEKSKVIVEFAEGVASAIEESEQENGGNVRIVVRPVRFIW